MAKMHRVGVIPDARGRTFARAGGVAALLVAGTLAVGVAALALDLPGLELRTWLVVLFQIDAGIGNLPPEPLRVFNPLDVAVLVLAAVTALGVHSVLPRPNRVWLAIAISVPVAGIGVLIATHLAGRSSLMAAGLAVSVLMTRDADLRRLGYLGIAADVLLLAGDVATGDDTESAVAVLIALGYLLLLAWFALLSRRLLASSA
jgi:hypothetical protein